jgi:hypothetical protein
MSDQPVAEASIDTGQHNIQTQETFMHTAGFEPAILATKRPQTYALERAATETGDCNYSVSINTTSLFTVKATKLFTEIV